LFADEFNLKLVDSRPFPTADARVAHLRRRTALPAVGRHPAAARPVRPTIKLA
jgi:hypothetical protein